MGLTRLTTILTAMLALLLAPQLARADTGIELPAEADAYEIPADPYPASRADLEAQGADPAVLDAAQWYAEDAGLDPRFVWAMLMKESGAVQFHRGRVYTGDGGAARGAGQIHRHPWQRFYSRELGRPIDLDATDDNCHCCVLLLVRGGALDDHELALGYYNTGRRCRYRRYSASILSQWQRLVLLDAAHEAAATISAHAAFQPGT